MNCGILVHRFVLVRFTTSRHVAAFSIAVGLPSADWEMSTYRVP
jgi:hypothetical protein